jgi:hypothetical protein
MGKISSAVAGVMIFMAAPHTIGRAEQSVPPVVGDYGPWGVDLTGMDRRQAGDDFFDANGAWYDRTRIALVVTAMGSTSFGDVVELRIRDPRTRRGWRRSWCPRRYCKNRCLYAAF